jgi:hypothetical protein
MYAENEKKEGKVLTYFDISRRIDRQKLLSIFQLVAAINTTHGRGWFPVTWVYSVTKISRTSYKDYLIFDDIC